MDEVIDIPGFGYGILTPATARVAPVTLVLLNAGLTHRVGPFRGYVGIARYLATRGVDVFRFDQIGRASCRERVCQYVSISVVAVSLKKKKYKQINTLSQTQLTHTYV